MDAAATLRAVPVLTGGEVPVGAVLGEAAIVHHDAALFGLLQACREASVEVRPNVRATGLDIAGGRVAGLQTDGGTIAAATVVNAAGAEATAVAATFGIELAMTPVRREALVCQPSRPFMTPAVTFYRPQEGWFNQTLRGELVAGSIDPAEPEGFREDSTLAFLAADCRAAAAQGAATRRAARDPPVGRCVRLDPGPRAADRRAPWHCQASTRSPAGAAAASCSRRSRPSSRPARSPGHGVMRCSRRSIRTASPASARHRTPAVTTTSLIRTAEDLVSAPVIIVGGGIVGCSTAYFLAREGCR